MTNKEAIEILTNVKNTPRITWTNGADVAFDLAIKALKFMDEHSDSILNETESEVLLTYLKENEK